MTRLGLVLPFSLIGALLAAPPAAAQQPAPVPAAARPWQVDWGHYYCTMIRRPGAGRPWSAAFINVPGGGATQLLLIPEGNVAWPRRIDSVVLMPGGQRFEVSAQEQRRGRQIVLSVTDLPYELRGMLEGARELQLRAGAAVRATIPVDQVRAAVAAHRQCTAGIAREWRIDEAGLAALSKRPRTTNLLGYFADDYPRGALARRTQGRVMLRIMINAAGRAEECNVVATSGNASIDLRSCEVAMMRGRFEPGLDAAGQPVAMAAVFQVTWRIPGVN
jgi:TonB family protein